MSPFGKSLEFVNEKDLQALLDSGFAENRFVEYKLKLPGRADADKREFVKDVVSFANSAGGHIIYGIEAVSGIPKKFHGIPASQVDEEKLRLEQILRTSIDPIIHGLKIQAVALSDGNIVLIIEIPRGLFGPHMIRGRGSFTSRNSAGKMEMDFSEVRAAFTGAETAVSKLQDFRAERTAKLAGGEEFIRLQSGGCILLHLLPLESFTLGFRCQLERISNRKTRQLLQLRETFLDWVPHFSFDGFTQIFKPELRTLPGIAYAHVFRNGALEYVDTETPERYGDKTLRPGFFEITVLAATKKFFGVVKQLELRGPFFVFASFLKCGNWSLVIPPENYRDADIKPIGRDNLILPEVYLESEASDLELAFRPAFDVLWNTCGWESSKSYDKDGKYSEQWQ